MIIKDLTLREIQAVVDELLRRIKRLEQTKADK